MDSSSGGVWRPAEKRQIQWYDMRWKYSHSDQGSNQTLSFSIFVEATGFLVLSDFLQLFESANVTFRVLEPDTLHFFSNAQHAHFTAAFTFALKVPSIEELL